MKNNSPKMVCWGKWSNTAARRCFSGFSFQWFYGVFLQNAESQNCFSTGTKRLCRPFAVLWPPGLLFVFINNCKTRDKMGREPLGCCHGTEQGNLGAGHRGAFPSRSPGAVVVLQPILHRVMSSACGGNLEPPAPSGHWIWWRRTHGCQHVPATRGHWDPGLLMCTYGNPPRKPVRSKSWVTLEQRELPQKQHLICNPSLP